MKSYDHSKIEKKWQETWAKAKMYETKDSVSGKDNFYLLVEFPYPSGNLHVGHWYSFAVPDIFARKMRMEGRNVMYPIGFDAFGLPAENAAIKNKVNPRDWTESNMEYMRGQIRSMGASFDWSRESITCHPDYYKWTQWLFLQLYKANLVYRKETMVNWCPNDKTVLANEQVIDGKCERCGHEVIQKEMLQWNIKITEYADRLIDDLEPLNWPEPIKESQRNWIGRSEGAEIDFGLDLKKKHKFVILHGFTSAPDRPRFIWLKAELEKMGHTVVLPKLPDTDAPNEKDQVEAALNATNYDENTVLCGFSLGSVVAMKVLEKLDRPISRLVTVGGFRSRNFKDNPRNFEKKFNWEFDADKIRHNAPSITILHDVNDYAVSEEQLAELEELLGVRAIRVVAEEPHFGGDKEPEVLMWLRPTIRVFTTRPDTLFGATYLVLAPEHPWVKLALEHKAVLKNNAEVEKYVEQASKRTELERQTDKQKTGVNLEGVDAVNPATGEKIPLYVADYVLAGYGTGAIMAVPAHDERDFEFAEKFNIPITQVVAHVMRASSGGDTVRTDVGWKERNAVMAIVKHWERDEYLCIQWKEHEMRTFPSGGIEGDESPTDAAIREVREETGYVNVEIEKQLGGYDVIEFYHQIKKTNVRAKFRYFLGKLKDDTREDIAKEESAMHEVVWKRPEELREFLMLKEKDRILDLLGGKKDRAYTGDGLLVNSGEFDGLSVDEAKKKMTEKFGRRKTTYKLRDWIVSRQRYWGVPIPIIHCPKCGTVPVPEDELPVLLPDIDDYLPDGNGKSPLAKVSSFVNVKCPQCNGDAERETDTLDTFVDSSWYFLRYTDPKNDTAFAAKEKQANWMPVDLYSGGAEHTTMHLLYSRFWHKALFDQGLVADSEPYVRRMNRGIILGPDGQKMSKSKGNVIDPDDVVNRLGADTVRMYLAFIGPYNEVASYPWSPEGIVGVRRFLERIWKAQELVTDASKLDEKKYDSIERPLHRAIKKVGEDATQLKFNTAISQLMILLNAIEKEKQIGTEQWNTLLKLLAPFAPHITEELWHEAGHKDSIHTEAWPTFDPNLLQDEEVTIAIQINGKTRDEVKVPSNSSKEETEKVAREHAVSRLEGKTIVRVVVVQNRLVNFVLSD